MGLESDIEKAGMEGFLGEKTETGEAFNFLTNDNDDEGGRPRIDFNTRLTDTQITGILSIETLQDMEIFPSEINLTRKLKRLNVSKNGEGRKELVSIAQGFKDEKADKKFLGMFGRRPE